jgi:hypothetical protein
MKEAPAGDTARVKANSSSGTIGAAHTAEPPLHGRHRLHNLAMSSRVPNKLRSASRNSPKVRYGWEVDLLA